MHCIATDVILKRIVTELCTGSGIDTTQFLGQTLFSRKGVIVFSISAPTILTPLREDSCARGQAGLISRYVID